MWLVDASFKLSGTFVNSFLHQVKGAASGQPHWLGFWFDLWADITAWNPHAFAYLTFMIELLTGLGLVLGFARRSGYVVAFVWSLAIWSIPEGFGGPYSSASTNIGTGIIYAVLFAALYGLDALAGEPAWALDSTLVRRIRWWRTISQPAPPSPSEGHLYFTR